MNLREYLSYKTVTLCFLAIGGMLFGMTGALADIGISSLLLLAGLYLLLIMTWLWVSFRIEKRKLEKLERLVEELPEKYLLGEVLPIPFGAVERQYYQVMKEISRSAVGMAEQARREKEEYCDYVESWIHEIKTPLTACSLILGGSRDWKKLKAELKRMDNLTESILYYARMRTAEKDTRIQKLSMATVIEEAAKSQMELLIAAKIRVEVCGDFEVYSDSKTLCFVLKQLLINCAKYCPGCLVKIHAGEGVVTVEDDGIGIPSWELGRVTDRGFTGTNGRMPGGSTGMGLYIARELCERLEVDMAVTSVQGEYTRITLSFRSLTRTLPDCTKICC